MLIHLAEAFKINAHRIQHEKKIIKISMDGLTTGGKVRSLFLLCHPEGTLESPLVNSAECCGIYPVSLWKHKGAI